MFRSMELILILLALISSLDAAKVPLTQQQLKEKYGQNNLASGDERNCKRLCDGKNMICYYEFNVQLYETMSNALCKNCQNNTIADCFNDGCLPGNGVARTIMSINQQLPGPSMDVCEGDRVIVDVTNSMEGFAVTLHWHGIFQEDSQYMDGVPMLTQCPIASATTFRYDFTVKQFGTYFYHAHTGIHRLNGLTGHFTIRTQNDPNADTYDVDLPENTIILLDWSNHLNEEKTPGTNTTLRLPNDVLINGFGSYFDSELGTFAYAPMPVFYVERGKRNLFRVVNARSDACSSDIRIEDEKLTVIATDGSPIEPIVVDSIVSTPGERFDFVFNAPSDPKINETLLTVQLLDECTQYKAQTFARIIFVDETKNVKRVFEHHEPLKKRPPFKGLDKSKKILNNPLDDCTDINSLCIASLKSKRTTKSLMDNLRNVDALVIPLDFSLVHNQDRSADYLSNKPSTVMLGTINGIANINPPSPPLVQGDDGISYCTGDNKPTNCTYSDSCHCIHLIELGLCEVYELLLFDTSADEVDRRSTSHPIHLHGYNFQVIDMGTRNQLKNGKSAFLKATHSPVLKDTVILQPNGFVRIRFRACNPGYWFFHCHYEFHSWSGMTLTFKVGDRNDLPPVPANIPRCGNFLPSIYES